MLDAAITRAVASGSQHIAITGAGGWLGLATLDLLHRALGSDFSGRVSCFGSSQRTLDLGGGRSVEQMPLSHLLSLQAERVWLLHFAFLTKDRAEAMSEGEYRRANAAISETVLAALDQIPVEAAFVASSGAAERADDSSANDAMRLYGAMKRADEDRFAAWVKNNNRRAVICRIFNITGPYINKHNAYAIANFILDGLAGRAIQVRADKEVIRAYVAIRELMSLVFALLGDERKSLVRFDSGGEPLELEAVARTVAAVVGGGTVERGPIVNFHPDRYVGDGRVYADLLKEYGIRPVGLRDQVMETAEYLKRAET